MLFKINQSELNINIVKSYVNRYNINYLLFSNEEDESIFNENHNDKNNFHVKTYSNNQYSEDKELNFHCNNLVGTIKYYNIPCNYNEFKVNDAKEINDFIIDNETLRDRYKWLVEDLPKINKYSHDLQWQLRGDLCKAGYVKTRHESECLSFKYRDGGKTYKVIRYIKKFINGEYILHSDMIKDIIKHDKQLIQTSMFL